MQCITITDPTNSEATVMTQTDLATSHSRDESLILRRLEYGTTEVTAMELRYMELLWTFTTQDELRRSLA